MTAYPHLLWKELAHLRAKTRHDRRFDHVVTIEFPHRIFRSHMNGAMLWKHLPHLLDAGCKILANLSLRVPIESDSDTTSTARSGTNVINSSGRAIGRSFALDTNA